MGKGHDGDGEKGTGEGRILTSPQNEFPTLAMKELVMLILPALHAARANEEGVEQ